MPEAGRLQAALTGMRLPTSQFERFASSQPVAVAEQEAGAEDVGRDEDMCMDEPDFEEGLGENGASVQPAELGKILFSDRAPRLWECLMSLIGHGLLPVTVPKCLSLGRDPSHEKEQQQS